MWSGRSYLSGEVGGRGFELASSDHFGPFPKRWIRAYGMPPVDEQKRSRWIKDCVVRDRPAAELRAATRRRAEVDRQHVEHAMLLAARRYGPGE